MAHIGMAVVVGTFALYQTAEDYAYQYKGDTGIDAQVSVVEDFEPHWPMMAELPSRFLVTVGEVPDSDRYEVQYTA